MRFVIRYDRTRPSWFWTMEDARGLVVGYGDSRHRTPEDCRAALETIKREASEAEIVMPLDPPDCPTGR